MSTVYSAYTALESKGLVRAKPKSGYVVVHQVSKAADLGRPADTGLQSGHDVDLEAIALPILGTGDADAATQFGSAYPDSSFIPSARLNCLTRDVSRRTSPGRIRDSAGLIELRREIAKRYTHRGYAVALDEIIVTTGSIDGVNLALRAVARPGEI
jgi:DNA-binding transcriptional MocR family regulator